MSPLTRRLVLTGFRALTAWNVHFARRLSLAVATSFADLSGWIFGGQSTGPLRPGLPSSDKDIPNAL